MGKWIFGIDRGQADMLRGLGDIHFYSNSNNCFFDLTGDTLQEAADNILHQLADAFKGSNVHDIIEYPEHVIIEDNLYGYANTASRNIKIVIPCKCMPTQVDGIPFNKDIRIILQPEKMDVAEMRALLNDSRAAFARRYNIPLRTLENWEAGKNVCPDYVRELLERAVREDAQPQNN